MKGKNNEDQFAVSAYRLSEGNPAPSLLAIISDGIGGHRAGEVASEIAVETISRLVAKSDGVAPRPILEEAILQASQKIFQQAGTNQAQFGMGATCVIAWVIESRLYAVAVGDSRLYLLRGNAITQLTTDHSWVQEAIDYGALTPEQARKHPNAHVLRRYLGSPNPPEPDFRLRLSPNETKAQSEANQGLQLLTGDILLLCSDGLTDLVNKEEIMSALKSLPREKALDSLIDLANQRGGHDNITVIVLEVPGGMEKTRISQSRSGRRRKLILPLVLALVAGFIVVGAILAVAGFYWLSTEPTASPTFLATVPANQIATSTLLPPTITPTATRMPATETQLPPTQTQGVQVSLTPWPTNTLALPSTTQP